MVLLALVPLASAAPTHAQMEAASWAHSADRAHDDAGEVKVFSATVAGVQCFKATARTSEVDAKTLLTVVTDIPGAKRWSSAGITQAEVLGRAGNKVSYYQYLDVPGWTMASDRYWFLEGEIIDAGARKEMRWSPLPPTSPHAARHQSFKTANAGAVEPDVNVGAWVFTQAEFGVDIAYMICTEGGSIPTAIQNAATRKTLPDTVGDVVREAKKRLGKN
jgi:hypothetical protein